jgi:cytochrome c
MTKLRETWPIGLGFCSALLVPQISGAQVPLPAAKPTDGATLFKQQCATCHTTNPSEPVRQGPSLFKIVGRLAGKVDGFHYSAGSATADFVWDDARLVPGWQTRRQSSWPTASPKRRPAPPSSPISRS